MSDDHIIRQAQREHESRQARKHEEARLTAAAAASASQITESKLEGLLAAAEARSEAFRAELSAKPATCECRQHAGQTAILVEEASFSAGRAVYRCPLCIRDATELRKERRIIQAGIPTDVRHATFENFDARREEVKLEKGFSTPAQFAESAQELHTRQIRNLLLCGSPGIGKGHLAAAVALARLQEGSSVAWVYCQQLFHDWHVAYSNGGPEHLKAKLVGTGLLVLDEIAMRDLPADGEEILFNILDGRHKAGLQTCLLSNATIARVKQWLGDRIVDRLRSGKIAACYGEWRSMRGERSDGSDGNVNEF